MVRFHSFEHFVQQKVSDKIHTLNNQSERITQKTKKTGGRTK
jgi:hypothetical protein